MFARHPLSIPSTTIYSILLVQFSCLTVLFHNLSPGPLWSSSWSGALYFTLHAFLHQSSFCNTCPYHRSLFCCNINVMSSIPNHSQLPTWKAVFQLNATHPPDLSHLYLLKCHHIFIPYRPGLTSMQHAASHTATVQRSSQSVIRPYW